MLDTIKFDTDAFSKRLLIFAQEWQRLVRMLPKTDFNKIYSGQLLRSSASPGANYIEALEASSKKEYLFRLTICRKETRESNYWLTLIAEANKNITVVQTQANRLSGEGTQIIKIITASILTSNRKSS